MIIWYTVVLYRLINILCFVDRATTHILEKLLTFSYVLYYTYINAIWNTSHCRPKAYESKWVPCL